MPNPASHYDLPAELIAKYATEGPRYTSYPTAPEWRNDWTAEEAEKAIADNQAKNAGKPLSIYVHLPFCRRLCYYCGCHTVITQRSDLVERYLTALELELAAMARRIPDRPVVQVHWGGGTPTHLSPEQIARVYGAIARHFPIARDAEVSIEVHPGVTTREQIETLAELGFNRIGMGVQDFDPVVQQAVNRVQSFEQTFDLVQLARQLGFESVNVDLIVGLPHQSLGGFGQTLDLVEQLAPDRLAVFSYAHVPWLKPHQKAIDSEALPGPAEKAALFDMTLDRLLARGYRYIGLDHFALPEDELSRAQDDRTLRRNFMGYTTRADSDLVGFGASSISDWDDTYLQNARGLPEYFAAVEAGRIPVTRGVRLTRDDRIRRDVINRLMCHGFLSPDEIEAAHGISFEPYFADELVALEGLIDDGLLEISASGYRVTPVGQRLIRNVAMTFDAYRRHPAPEGPRYSQTV
jgi:oxygen-independent coproporphyrinogen-3 oxidase